MQLPRILVTGFGPFPNAPVNPTARLIEALAAEPPDALGAAALRAVVLPTEYRRSWAILRRVYSRFGPDLVVHFGLSGRSNCLKVERVGSKTVDPERPDAVGFAPQFGLARRSGPQSLPCRFPVDAVLSALADAGFPAAASDDAGGYVCNATFYRSLAVAEGTGRLVGFVHVPPESTNGYTAARLQAAAQLILRAAASMYAERAGHAQMAMGKPRLSRSGALG